MQGLEIVVTGGTGALGRAVVAQLIDAGARCHIPVLSAEAADRFDLSSHPSVVMSGPVDMTDEDQVCAYYEALPPLWASIHVVGGFAMAPLL